MRKKSKRICYLCGVEGATTKDHIPPRGIFPKEPKGQLITVNAHKHCNEKFQQDDELFRNVIIAASNRTNEGKKAWEEQVVSSWKSNPGAKKDLNNLLIPSYVHDIKNNFFIPCQDLGLDYELFKRQIIRWTRGLYFKQFNKALSQDCLIDVQRLPPPEESVLPFIKHLSDGGNLLKWIHVEPKIFSYTLITSNEADDIGFVMYVFFNTEVYFSSFNVLDHSKK
jgi:hypothetical protein